MAKLKRHSLLPIARAGPSCAALLLHKLRLHLGIPDNEIREEQRGEDPHDNTAAENRPKDQPWGKPVSTAILGVVAPHVARDRDPVPASPSLPGQPRVPQQKVSRR